MLGAKGFHILISSAVFFKGPPFNWLAEEYTICVVLFVDDIYFRKTQIFTHGSVLRQLFLLKKYVKVKKKHQNNKNDF